MNPETGINGEAPVKFLLLWTEIPCRLGHRDDQRLIDFIGPPVSNDGRLPAGDNVLHPIGAFAIRDGDQKTVMVLNRHDRCLVGPTRTASHVADDWGVGLLRPCGPYGEWSCRLRESAQGCLDGTFDSLRLPHSARPFAGRISIHLSVPTELLRKPWTYSLEVCPGPRSSERR